MAPKQGEPKLQVRLVSNRNQSVIVKDDIYAVSIFRLHLKKNQFLHFSLSQNISF